MTFILKQFFWLKRRWFWNGWSFLYGKMFNGTTQIQKTHDDQNRNLHIYLFSKFYFSKFTTTSLPHGCWKSGPISFVMYPTHFSNLQTPL